MHMAWVFLTDRHAYKLKKPVAYTEPDFTTLARQHWACWRTARGKHVAEGHGDLRPEHICLIDQPVIFDCIEFDRSFRLLDVLSFLSMECERLGAPGVGPVVLEAYAGASGDTPPDSIVHFYQSYRALQRAQIAVRHARRANTPDEAKWSGQAAAYLRLATRHTGEL